MRIDGLINVRQLNQANVLDILGRFGIGDVIKAKVLEMTSGELLLKLFDGTVFKAATSADMDAKPGEILELTVTGKNDVGITLETVKKNFKQENSQNEVKKLLISMDIDPKPENIELAEEIKAAGVKIDPGIFNKASELIKRFSELTPEKAVFLASRDIKPEQGGLDNLIKLLEGRLKLGKQLDELQQLLSQMDSETLAGPDKNDPLTPKITANIAQKPVPPAEANSLEQLLPGDAAKQAPDRVRQSPSPKNGVLSADETVSLNESSAAGENRNQSPNRVQKDPGPDANKTAPSRSSMETEMADRSSSSPQTKASIGDIPAAAVKPKGGEAEKPIESGMQTELKSVKKLASELERLKEDFKSLFVRMDSKDLKTELEIKKIYRDLTEKLDAVKSAVAGSGIPGAEDIVSRVNSLDDGLRLMNQINSNSAYYQIPINISGFNTTGELYIMKREHKRKRIDPGNVTMFISLDTQNIGRIEAITDIKGKNVSMNLRAEEQGIIDFIKGNFKLLYNSLLEKGYRLVDVRYRLIEAAVNPVNVDRIIRKELGGGRTSVDMKI